MRTHERRGRWTATATALVMTGALVSGCGDDGDDAAEPAPAPATTTPGAVGGGTVDNYFGGADFVGQTVAVQGEVTRILSPIAFELNAEPYGDASVLALSRSEMTDVTAGRQVIVSGTVEEFSADVYADDYGLTGDGTYDAYEGERFLAVSNVEPVPGG